MPKKDKTPRKPTLKQQLVKDLRDKVKTAKATWKLHDKNLKSLQGRRASKAQRSKAALKVLSS
jgi:hypothetical protein